ncbi:hypothetical protein [Streptomyces sp. NPDC005548]|uniref:hypothetical protein n=1 Tax=Streptomyces sp. NPDC005548 TaxID=3364724 RepID=UPI003679D336
MPEVLAWADDFLMPYFCADTTGSAPDHQVTAVYRSGTPLTAYEQTRPQPLFLGRTGLRFDSGGREYVQDTRSGDLFEIRPSETLAHYRSQDPYAIRDPARLVRECAVDALCRKGALRLHAAAAVVRERGLLLLGAGGAGKSSTLAHLLAEGAAFLANDRLLAVQEAGAIRLYGVPLAVRWSADQLDGFADGRDFRQSYATCSALRRTDTRAGFRKYELTPREVAAVTGAALVTEAPASAVVVVDRGPGTGTPHVTPVTPDLDLLRAHTLDQDPAFPAFFRTALGATPADATPFAALPWFRLRGHHRDTSGEAQLLDTLCDHLQ